MRFRKILKLRSDSFLHLGNIYSTTTVPGTVLDAGIFSHGAYI